MKIPAVDSLTYLALIAIGAVALLGCGGLINDWVRAKSPAPTFPASTLTINWLEGYEPAFNHAGLVVYPTNLEYGLRADGVVMWRPK